MAVRDKELNELLAKRLLADVAADAVLQNHLDNGSERFVFGVFHGAGEQTGASGWYRQKD